MVAGTTPITPPTPLTLTTLITLITPHWPVATTVGACSTTRQGGSSQGAYASLNLSLQVGDNPTAVIENRRRLKQLIALPSEPIWLEQVHGTRCLNLADQPITDRQADASYSTTPGQICAVLTADCLPVLIATVAGDEVAAVHAGWRGLVSGILEQTVAQFRASRANLLVWLGPAIGPSAFRVDASVRAQFLVQHPAAAAAFIPHSDGYLMDINKLARQRLQALGVSRIYGGNDGDDVCTVTDRQRFFSYRRDGITGRMASLIWLK